MDSIFDLIKNLKTTAFSIGITDVVEILIIAFIIYKLFVWMKNSRTWFLLKGLLVLALMFLVAEILQLNTILYIAKSALDIMVIALLVVFHPELRSALERLGKESKILKFFTRGENSSTYGFSNESRSKITEAVFDLAKAKTGALIVIEREYPLADYIKTGIPLDADISEELLENIFEHNTPLHDGAVIVCRNKIVAATCLLPLSKNQNISKEYGTRHRAAIGVSEETDAFVIVVSEETGHVSYVQDGVMHQVKSKSELITELNLISDNEETEKKFSIRRQKDEESDSE